MSNKLKALGMPITDDWYFQNNHKSEEQMPNPELVENLSVLGKVVIVRKKNRSKRNMNM